MGQGMGVATLGLGPAQHYGCPELPPPVVVPWGRGCHNALWGAPAGAEPPVLGVGAEGEVWLLGPGWSAASPACAWPCTPLICSWPLTRRLTSRLDLGPSPSLWTFLASTGLWLTLVAVTGPDPDLACC